MNYKIIPAQPLDAEKILEYLKTVGGETDNLTFGKEGVPFSIEEEEKFLLTFKNSKDNMMLLAKDGETLIAVASLNRLSGRMSHRGELGISVLKKYWNKGIGSALIQKILIFAKENNFDIVELNVRSDNKNAIHLYEKFGFEKLCTIPNFFKIQNESIDFDLMNIYIK